MKLKITILIVFGLSIQSLHAQTRQEIIKYKISRVDQSWMLEGKPNGGVSIYYDSIGNIVKKITRVFLRLTKTNVNTTHTAVETYQYIDTLPLVIEMKGYRYDSLEGTRSDIFQYQFIKDGLIGTKSLVDRDGKKTKEQYVYNDKGKLDSVYFFNDDSAVRISGIEHGVEQGQNITLKKTRKYSYAGDDTVIIKECRTANQPGAAMGCEIDKSMEKDNVEMLIRDYYSDLELGSEERIDTTISYKKDGLVYLEDYGYGNESRYLYKKNKLGLITRMEEDFRFHPKKKFDEYSSITYQYFYRQ